MKILSAVILISLGASLYFLMFANTGIPEGMTPVKGFDVKRFTGTWYEIARLDHGFEKGLSHVSAEYSLREDGGIKVINKGFNMKKGQWENASARGYFIDSPDIGRLKVSFFGPFYGSYNIIDLDEKNYSYAMVTGPKINFFWILSRQKTLDPNIMQSLIQKAKSMGFKLEKLILVDQKEDNVPAEGKTVTIPPLTQPAAAH
jgi:apolipoprotein D and lipocalin family protein